jgi:hypothetical protein
MLTETEPANSYVGNHQPIERYGDFFIDSWPTQKVLKYQNEQVLHQSLKYL